MANYVDSPERDRNPSPPPELKENTELLEADTIANTAFSKHWLFSTLMKLIEEVDKEVEDTEDADFGVDVDEEMQNELCKLWDMSMNMINKTAPPGDAEQTQIANYLKNEGLLNVAKFLQEFQAVDILMGVINKSKAPRVTEICVGILGNMACDQEICKEMSENTKFINMALALLENRDPPTLVETTRLLYTSLSKTETCQPWISGIKQSNHFLENLIFIFGSSTNCDLLKNAGELLDVVLDQEEGLCETWATTQLLHSQLEAIKQIGCGQSEALEIYFHVFQLFSTTEQGVEALVECSRELEQPLMKYLDVTCEDEIVGLEGRESCLASALSVLNILFLSDESLHQRLATDEKLLRMILKILEPLYPWLSSLNCEQTKSSSSTELSSSEDTHSPSQKENNNATEDSGHEPDSSAGTSEATQKQKYESIRKQLSMLYNIVKGFLYDLVTSLCELEDNSLLKVLKYLNSSCSRTRLNYLILTLMDTKKEPIDIVEWLTDATSTHKQERLAGIIDNVVSGRYLEREDSGQSSVDS